MFWFHGLLQSRNWHSRLEDMAFVSFTREVNAFLFVGIRHRHPACAQLAAQNSSRSGAACRSALRPIIMHGATSSHS